MIILGELGSTNFGGWRAGTKYFWGDGENNKAIRTII